MNTEGTAENTPDQKTNAPEKKGFTFTDDGCRVELRLGILLVIAATFLWQFLATSASSSIAHIMAFLGLGLMLIAIPLQALDAKKYSRPGYPIKIGIIFTVMGLLMLADNMYRERWDESLHIIFPWGVLLPITGTWTLLWWPISRQAKNN